MPAGRVRALILVTSFRSVRQARGPAQNMERKRLLKDYNLKNLLIERNQIIWAQR